jgi:Zn-finger protein
MCTSYVIEIEWIDDDEVVWTCDCRILIHERQRQKIKNTLVPKKMHSVEIISRLITVKIHAYKYTGRERAREREREIIHSQKLSTHSTLYSVDFYPIPFGKDNCWDGYGTIAWSNDPL